MVEVLKVLDAPSGGRIEACRGDLARLGQTDCVDIVVVSAFRDDYLPTASSLIGALDRRGVSVAHLAVDKFADLRQTTSCWLSNEIPDGQARYGFSRLLCYEPSGPTVAAETVGDVFRALVPFVGGTTGARRVAMPALATGDMQHTIREMVTAILDAALHWMESGLQLERLQIVAYDEPAADEVCEVFLAAAPKQRAVPAAETLDIDRPYDFFVSYAREDGSDAADQVMKAIKSLEPTAKVFLDRQVIRPGAAWQQAIYDCLDSCRKVVVLLTPAFFSSKVCQEELNIALIRNRNSERPVLHPLYLRSAELPPHVQILNYLDCREVDPVAIQSACSELIADG